jgi:hypothetical protein
MTGARSFSVPIVNEAVGYADMIRKVLTEELAFKKELDQKFKEAKVRAAGIENVISEVSSQSPDRFFCSFDSLMKAFNEKALQDILLEASSGIIPDSVKKETDYCRTIDALGAGIASPLKISFQPDTAYYPLEISSLGEGYSMIDVYVIADRAVEDSNRAFKERKTLALKKPLKDKITKEFQKGPWKYVTRFSWAGQLKDLKKDAMFMLH